jgi:hypothetical protein
MRHFECSYCGGTLPEPFVELTPLQRKLYERLKLEPIYTLKELNRFFYGPKGPASQNAGYSILQRLAKNLIHSPLQIRATTVIPYQIIRLDGSPYAQVPPDENNSPTAF